MAVDELAGAWRLRSFTFTDADGNAIHPLGENPAGFVLITPDGYLALNFMAGGRAGFAADDLFGGNEEERARAVGEVVAFAGPCQFDGHAVSVNVEFSVFPNWIGSTQVRNVEISGDMLVLTTQGANMFAGALRRAEARLVRASERDDE